MERIAGLATIAALAATGCHTTWDIAPRELTKLNGYRAPQTVVLEDTGGGTVDFSGGSRLTLSSPQGEVSLRVREARVEGPTFVAVPRGEEGPVAIDLRQLGRVQVRNFSVGKTVGLTVGVTLGAAAVAVGLGVLFWASALSAGTSTQ